MLVTIISIRSTAALKQICVFLTEPKKHITGCLKKILATGILVFDFELFIGGRYRILMAYNKL